MANIDVGWAGPSRGEVTYEQFSRGSSAAELRVYSGWDKDIDQGVDRV
jgi:hypothetical protein